MTPQQIQEAEDNIVNEYDGGLQQVENALSPTDKYLVSYPSMRRTSQFYCTTAQTVGGAFREHSIIAIACIAYNWINNQILTYWDTEGNDHADGLTILHAKNIATPEQAIQFVQRFARSPINTPEAWVGLSKVLHFINPQFFPMWDIQVAKNFKARPNEYTIEQYENHVRNWMDHQKYICYINWCHGVLDPEKDNHNTIDVRRARNRRAKIRQAVKKVQNLFVKRVGYGVSRIRTLEFILFVIGRQL